MASIPICRRPSFSQYSKHDRHLHCVPYLNTKNEKKPCFQGVHVLFINGLPGRLSFAVVYPFKKHVNEHKKYYRARSCVSAEIDIMFHVPEHGSGPVAAFLQYAQQREKSRKSETANLRLFGNRKVSSLTVEVEEEETSGAAAMSSLFASLLNNSPNICLIFVVINKYSYENFPTHVKILTRRRGESKRPKGLWLG